MGDFDLIEGVAAADFELQGAIIERGEDLPPESTTDVHTGRSEGIQRKNKSNQQLISQNRLPPSPMSGRLHNAREILRKRGLFVQGPIEGVAGFRWRALPSARCPADVGKSVCRSSTFAADSESQKRALDDYARDQWIATHILPHEGEVRAWVRRHVHGLVASDVDDLVQDAYARLWTVDFRRIANGRSYLFAVIRNLLLEQSRRARIVPMERIGEVEALRIPSEEPGPDRRVSARQELDRLERVVARLPKRCRRAFELQKFQGFSQREIASRMSITEKTVERHLALALSRVTEALKEEAGEPVPQSQPGNSGYGSEQNKD